MSHKGFKRLRLLQSSKSKSLESRITAQFSLLLSTHISCKRSCLLSTIQDHWRGWLQLNKQCVCIHKIDRQSSHCPKAPIKTNTCTIIFNMAIHLGTKWSNNLKPATTKRQFKVFKRLDNKLLYKMKRRPMPSLTPLKIKLKHLNEIRLKPAF